MKKRALVALMAMVLTICLAGCNLVGVNPEKRADREISKLEEEFSTVLAEYEGGQVTAMDIRYEFMYSYSEMAQYYPYYGIEVTDEMVEQLKNDCVDNKVSRLAHVAEAGRRGVELTEEELQEIETTLSETFESESKLFLESAEGANAAEKQADARVMMVQWGFTRENLTNYMTEVELMDKVTEAVKAEVADLTEAELEEYYQQKVSEDEEAYRENFSGYESAMTSADTVIAWNPEGYRTVKHILIVPDSETLDPVLEKRQEISALRQELDSLRSELAALEDDDPPEDAEAQRAALEADIASLEERETAANGELQELEAACLDSVRDKLDDIHSRLEAGESFESLIAEYGEDPGMKNEPTASRGYFVRADSTKWDTNFRDAAMLLDKAGDVSAPVIGSSGIHIIRYESDVTPGPVPMEDIAEALRESALEAARTEHYEKAVEDWISQLNVTYHYDAWSPLSQ